MVDTRLFDLRAGRTILIAPQKDGSLRSMQIDSPMMEPEEVEAYQGKLIRSPKVAAS